MISFWIWNIRGFNKQAKVDTVNKYITHNNIDVIALLEPRVRRVNTSSLYNKRFPGWEADFCYEDDLGKIWLLWKKDVPLKVIQKTSQLIHFSIDLPTAFSMTVVYASNDVRKRRMLFEDLLALQTAHLPWMTLGDYNAILNLAEASNTPSSFVGMDDFIDFVQRGRLVEHPAQGPDFTWTNNQDIPIARKLDRALINQEWQNVLKQSRVRVMPAVDSDHCALMVQIGEDINSLPKPFKFYSCWMKHPSFPDLLKEAWSKRFYGSPFSILYAKLRRLKGHLKKLNDKDFSNIQARVTNQREMLEKAKLAVFTCPSQLNMRVMKDSERRLADLVSNEECVLRLKSRVLWIQQGDCNSSFFARYVSERQTRNTIRQLLDSKGALTDDVKKMGNIAVDYYKNLLGVSTYMPDNFKTLVSKRVTAAQVDMLDADVTRREMKDALFSMASDKAPGPDGYSASFYKNCWETVGEDVLNAMEDFFRSGALHPSVNSTIITLIPKKSNAESIKDYRPISCCNTIYKALSKVLANRLCKVLPDLVSPSQTAFIKGRAISDNVILAHELLAKYGRKKASPRCALKIDLMKAFDSIEWSFVEHSLKAMDFPPRYVHWIMACFNSSRFSVNLNGSLIGYFPGGKGLRQGDPISPYLFVLAMQILEYLFEDAASKTLFQYHPQCRKVKLTHLCFADDLLVFTKGNTDAVVQVRAVLDKFQTISGLQFNPEKSDIYTAGVNRGEKDLMVAAAGFREGKLPLKYLGIPISAGKLSKPDCRVLVDKITARVKNWKAKLLNYAGKMQLIKSVVHGILQYWLSMFVIPAAVLNEIELICARFLWGKNEGQRVKVAWHNMAYPLAEGGLGFKELSGWNSANIMRHLWNLLIKSGSLWVAWIEAYRLKGRDVWSVNTATGSWHWRKILKLRQIARMFVTWDDEGDVLWNGSYLGKFKPSTIWDSIRPRLTVEPWAPILWKGLKIPKNSMITWLVLKDRISTLDKVAIWYAGVNQICPLCGDFDESRQHLFLDCDFSRKCYEVFFTGWARFGSWDNLVQFISKWHGKNPVDQVKSLVWCAVTSEVWRERCRRLYATKRLDEGSICAKIAEDVIACVSGHKDKNIMLCSIGLK
ncbi:Transposon TX1 uncharacterized 149 kDa protein [Linum perenne]